VSDPLDTCLRSCGVGPPSVLSLDRQPDRELGDGSLSKALLRAGATVRPLRSETSCDRRPREARSDWTLVASRDAEELERVGTFDVVAALAQATGVTWRRHVAPGGMVAELVECSVVGS
jgi:hypothetical protein